MLSAIATVFGLRRAVITVLAATAAMALAPAAAQAKPKPDFTVTSVKVTAGRATPFHIIEGRVRNGIDMFVTVKNVGDKAAAGAGRAVFRGSGLLRPEQVRFDVPRLRPHGGKTEIIVGVDNYDLAGITTYKSKVGASTRKDSDHGNDYRRGPSFAVIPRVWSGTTTATWTDGVVIESLVAQPRFTLDEEKSEAEKKFVYTGAGTLSATITGDLDPDCTFSGSGDTAIDPTQAFLWLDPDLLHFRASGNMPDSTTYTAAASCFGGGSAPYTQIYGMWLATPITFKDATDEVLTGTQNSVPPDTWSWTLNAGE